MYHLLLFCSVQFKQLTHLPLTNPSYPFDVIQNACIKSQNILNHIQVCILYLLEEQSTLFVTATVDWESDECIVCCCFVLYNSNN